MLIYTAEKHEFVEHVRNNEIEGRILEQMRSKRRFGPSRSEVASWRNSLQYMTNVIDHRAIPDDCGVALEYIIPQTSKRIDFVLSGRNPDERASAVIVELKQWENASETAKDAVVKTFLGGSEREVPHPSYQAWTYAALLEDFNEAVREDEILLRPCAYLHNCTSDAIRSEAYRDHLERAPSFLKSDVAKLRRFIQQNVRRGDRGKILYRIENGRIRPSKSLADHLASLLQENREFLMIDDQKLVFEKALEIADLAEPSDKHVLIVNGGPGTGKSVVAVNLLVELIKRDRVAHYVTRNRAPRQVYRAKLAGTLKGTRIDELFKGPGTYQRMDANSLDVLVVDEAHRLNEKSGLYGNEGENQIKEIIEAATATVFFLDEDQRVTWRDIGSREEIEEWAESAGARVHYADLQSQFRCNGSEGYLAWLDNALQIRETATRDVDELDYFIEVVDSPTQLRDRIFSLNVEANCARLLAGYCWDWTSKKNPANLDIELPEYRFAMRWNLEQDGGLWMIKPNSVHEIGCIHTAQGLELDYAGVIIGPDLVVRDGTVVTRPSERSRQDSSIKGYKKARRQNRQSADAKADAIIKNTYRTLLSRGLKGCLIWCVDPETNEYFKSLVESSRGRAVEMAEAASEPTLRRLSRDEVEPFVNAVPLLDLRVAAGDFVEGGDVASGEWVKLPEFISPAEGMFVAQVVGDSMNRRIPNGAWCLFQKPSGGTREGKIVLVQHRDIQDPDTGGSFTVKRYHSEKVVVEDGAWRHARILLLPDSDSARYRPIELFGEAASEFRVVGEFRAVLDP